MKLRRWRYALTFTPIAGSSHPEQLNQRRFLTRGAAERWDGSVAAKATLYSSIGGSYSCRVWKDPK